MTNLWSLWIDLDITMWQFTNDIILTSGCCLDRSGIITGGKSLSYAAGIHNLISYHTALPFLLLWWRALTKVPRVAFGPSNNSKIHVEIYMEQCPMRPKNLKQFRQLCPYNQFPVTSSERSAITENLLKFLWCNCIVSRHPPFLLQLYLRAGYLFSD